jgi:hypothetical protein
MLVFWAFFATLILRGCCSLYTVMAASGQTKAHIAQPVHPFEAKIAG